MAQAPIQFDRASGALEGANLWERMAALALVDGIEGRRRISRIGLHHLRQSAAQDAAGARHPVRLNDDAVFEFPYGDGYWSKLLNRILSL